jgi:hypothetical protein
LLTTSPYIGVKLNQSQRSIRIARWVAFRYSAIGETQISGPFTPFGFGTLACSTRVDFAPKVIIILIARLYNVLREAGVGRLAVEETFDSTQAAVGDKERQPPECVTDKHSAGRNDPSVDMDDAKEMW